MTPTILDFFTSTVSQQSTHSSVLTNPVSAASLDMLIQLLGDKIVAYRCRNLPDLYHAWRARIDHNTVVPINIKSALEAFIKPVFGLPGGTPIAKDHLEGYISENLWYFLYQELPNDGNILRIEPPSFKATDPGGDSLVIYRLKAGYLMFRLWEIKKSSGDSGTVDAAVNRAYKQLDEKAMEYLARLTAIAQETDDEEMADFCGQLPQLWAAASPQAAAGVSVATSVVHIRPNCFDDFGDKFPNFIAPVRLKGMLTAVEDFSDFSEKVRDFVWTGL